MSRLYETLRRIESQHRRDDAGPVDSLPPVELVSRAMTTPREIEGCPTARIDVSPKTRLVSFTDPAGLGAEKFRALVTRLEHQRRSLECRSLQVISAVVNEGKTLVSANLSVTLANHTGARVLVVEGDLHRPSLASLFGLGARPGIGQWWSSREEKGKISQYLHRLENTSLWLLAAGSVSDRPSQILQSARFAEMFGHLVNWFDWVVVDSTPMSPMIDASLWSRLVDGMLLVIRENVAPVRLLKKGLEALDDPKLLGIVLNEASDFDATNYADQYYALSRPEGHEGPKTSD